ncbi:MAG TPA: formylglycine-generating enzyme family protein, partial [Planctomycetes bacterium]|nr:formylglycine-generating enzyme family protein [Planctomycetota bacterium]
MPIAPSFAVLLLLAGPVPAGEGILGADSSTEMKPYSEKIPGSALSIEWVPIPVGEEGYPSTVTIGSPAGEVGRLEDEGPTFRAQIEPFWMMKCEVTWDVFDLFRREYSLLQDLRIPGDEIETSPWIDAVSIPTPLWEQDSAPILQGLGTSGGFPVVDISQFAAMQFSKWLSLKTGKFLRLATEAEWEYAARAGTDTPWFFGDDAEDLEKFAWFFDNSAYDDPDAGYPGLGAGYRKVGTLLANPWGLHDIYGNVAEWVLDGYSENSYKKLEGKTLSW